jgi:hypothetical protein
MSNSPIGSAVSLPASLHRTPKFAAHLPHHFEDDDELSALCLSDAVAPSALAAVAATTAAAFLTEINLSSEDGRAISVRFRILVVRCG